jgi:hypothetical protein
MVAISLSQKDTLIEVVSDQIICSTAANSVPKLESLSFPFPPTSTSTTNVVKFVGEAIAYSFDTSTLLVCGGNQDASVTGLVKITNFLISSRL